MTQYRLREYQRLFLDGDIIEAIRFFSLWISYTCEDLIGFYFNFIFKFSNLLISEE